MTEDFDECGKSLKKGLGGDSRVYGLVGRSIHLPSAMHKLVVTDARHPLAIAGSSQDGIVRVQHGLRLCCSHIHQGKRISEVPQVGNHTFVTVFSCWRADARLDTLDQAGYDGRQ